METFYDAISFADYNFASAEYSFASDFVITRTTSVTQNMLYTKQALLSITNKIQEAVDEGTYSRGIFLDFSKSFDTLNHNILTMKLDHYYFRGIAKKRIFFLPQWAEKNCVNPQCHAQGQYLEDLFSYTTLMFSMILLINLIFIYLLTG